MQPAEAQRGGFRGGGGRGGAAGGFDLHNDAGGVSHASTGPAGTNRDTSVSNTGGTYNRTTTASNGSYSRTSGGSYNQSTGNYSHTAGASSQYGSYATSGYGNAYDRTYKSSGTATNAYGQTRYSGTYASNGVVYHGATVANPAYVGYPAWGWNGGMAWYAAPNYWAGGFWGPFAVGAVSAAAFGTVVYENQTYASYEVQPTSAGAKLLESYGLTQTPCGAANLVVIYGPSGSVICANPNNLVQAGNYSVNESTLTLISEKT